MVDPWEAAISRWIEDRSSIDLQRPVTSQRIMVDVLGLRLSDTDQRAQNRVAAVMKRLVGQSPGVDRRTNAAGLEPEGRHAVILTAFAPHRILH